MCTLARCIYSMLVAITCARTFVHACTLLQKWEPAVGVSIGLGRGWPLVSAITHASAHQLTRSAARPTVQQLYKDPPKILRKATLRQLHELDAESALLLLTDGAREVGAPASVTFDMKKCREQPIWNNRDGEKYTVYLGGNALHKSKAHPPQQPEFHMKCVY